MKFKLSIAIIFISTISVYLCGCNILIPPDRSNEVIVSDSMYIGKQIWTITNLNVDHYRNGDLIPQVKNLGEWSSIKTGAWCYYNNDSVNGYKYGKLYNWYAVHDSRGLAPIGWHIPSSSEWGILYNHLGGDTVAGGKMKSYNIWRIPNSGATNSSNFTALPGGFRELDGTYKLFNYNAYFWNSSQVNNDKSYCIYLAYNYSKLFIEHLDKRCGMSIRCVKD